MGSECHLQATHLLHIRHTCLVPASWGPVWPTGNNSWWRQILACPRHAGCWHLCTGLVSLAKDSQKYSTLKAFLLKCFSFSPSGSMQIRSYPTTQLGDRRPSQLANYPLTTLGEFPSDILLQQVFLCCFPPFVQGTALVTFLQVPTLQTSRPWQTWQMQLWHARACRVPQCATPALLLKLLTTFTMTFLKSTASTGKISADLPLSACPTKTTCASTTDALALPSGNAAPMFLAAGKLPPSSPAAMMVQGASSTVLQVRGTSDGWLYLNDTGAEVSVLPHSPASASSTDSPALFAANGTAIPTFGSCTHVLHLGGHLFAAHFLLAVVQHPLLGANFLCSH